MNRWNLATENIFRSEENTLWLRKQLMYKFGLHRKDGDRLIKTQVYNFINENIGSMVGEYDLRHLMDYSSPIVHLNVEPDVHAQVRCLNSQWLQDRYDFIVQNVLDNKSGTHGQWLDRKKYGVVSVSDVSPASGRTQYFGINSAEGSNPRGIIATDVHVQNTPMGPIPPSLDPVASWNQPSRPIQLRDDSKAQEGAVPPHTAPLQESNFAYSYQYNDEGDGIGDDGESDPNFQSTETLTGSRAATGSRHMQALVGNNYYKTFNDESLTNSRPASFNPNSESSAEYEQILYNMGQGTLRATDVSDRDLPKWYNQSLHSRPYNRDIAETLSGVEYEAASTSGRHFGGYDRSTLFCRVEKKQRVCYEEKRNEPINRDVMP